MADNLEQIGVEAILKNINTFTKDMERYVKSVDKGTDQTEKMGEKAEKTTKKIKLFEGGLKGAVSGMLDFAGIGGPIGSFIEDLSESMIEASGSAAKLAGSAGGGKGGLASVFSFLSNPIGLAIAGVVALGAAFVGLGFRGAAIAGIEDSFDRLAAKTGISADILLKNMHRASAGMIDDVTLMKGANEALTGSTDDVAAVFGEALPNFLEVARVRAAATGEDVTQLFDDIVRGTKRGSAAILDNLGIIVKSDDAYQRYADTLGRTVESLTEEEKKIAFIQEVVRQSGEQVELLGDVNETAADKIDRATATITNIFDRLALAVQPAFAATLDVINGVLTAISGAVDFIVPIITAGLALIGKVISFQAKIIKPPVQFIINLIGSIATFVNDHIADFAKGAGNLIGAYANGLLLAANTLLFPVIIKIATFIADFLSGFSPPKRGPLSTIDQGGENLINAWTEGIVGGFSLDPVNKVSKEVDGALGKVGELSRSKVEARLLSLDKALLPFQQRLDIVKARVEEIEGPAKAMLDVLNDQIARAEEEFLSGGGDADALRNLRVKKEQIESVIGLQDEQIRQAQLQLALKQAEQIEERTLLRIRQQQLGPAREIAKVTKMAAPTTAATTGGGKDKKPKLGAGGGPSPIEEESGVVAGEIAGAVEEEIQDPLAGLKAIGGEFTEGFFDSLNAGGEADIFENNLGSLQEQLGRIGESNPVQGLVDSFTGLGTSLKENLVDPISDVVEEAVGWFTDPNQEGGFAHLVNKLTNEGARAVIGDFAQSLRDGLQENIVDPISEGVADAIGWFTESGKVGGLANYFANIRAKGFRLIAGDLIDSVTTWFTENLIDPVTDKVSSFIGYFIDTEQEGSLAAFFSRIVTEGFSVVAGVGIGAAITEWVLNNLISPITDKVRDLMDPEIEGSIPYYFGLIQDRILTAVGDLGYLFKETIFGPIRDFVYGNVEGGGLPQIIEDVSNHFKNIPIGIWNALRNIGLIAWNVLVVPFIEAINYVIEKINEFFLAVTSSTLADFARDTFNLSIPEVHFNEISPQAPGILLNPSTGGLELEGGKTGGLFSQGMMRVHRGEEIISSSKPLAVFSDQFVKATELFSNAIASMTESPMSDTGGVTNINSRGDDNRSITVNATSADGYTPIEIANRLSMERIFR